MSLRKTAQVFAVSTVALAGILFAPGTASAAPAACEGTYSIGIGGVSQNTSAQFYDVSQRVGYSALPFAFSIQEGANEINRLFVNQRKQCPDQHIKIIGHSAGAAAAHVFVTQRQPTNANAILLADPKRPAGPLGAGASQNLPWWIGYPLVGTDSNYGNVPVLQVCNAADPICNSSAPLYPGYVTSHGVYDYSAKSYADDASGTIIK